VSLKGVMMVWNKFDDLLQNKTKLPKVSCAYVIYFNDKLVYIGSTQDLKTRYSGREIRYGFAKNIHTRWGSFNDDTKITLKYKPIKRFGFWLALEARLIRKLQPIFNKKLKKAIIHHG
tara:strand:- start:396 stop:749 length:354 start_codon:yes stop_codon:yes gene_type:complete